MSGTDDDKGQQSVSGGQGWMTNGMRGNRVFLGAWVGQHGVPGGQCKPIGLLQD